MYKRMFQFFICLFLISCASPERTFDYSDTSFTYGLTVSSQPLNFQNEDIKFLSLHFSEKDLFLSDIDYSGLGLDFVTVMNLEPNNCRQSISTSQQGCTIGLQYKPTGQGQHTGRIVLKFIYTDDYASNKIKEHFINVSGTN